MSRAFTRRALLAATPAVLGAGAARALSGGHNPFTVAQLQHGGNWNPRPTAMRRLLWEVSKRTSIDVAADATAVTTDARELFYQPFLYWTSDGEFPPLDARAREKLARYLAFGGFILCDSVDGAVDRGAAASFRRELGALTSNRPLDVIPREHVLFKSFYLLDRAEGRMVNSPDLWGITVDNRVAAVLTVNDLGGAYARDNFGYYLHEVVPGGDLQRDRAFRLGVNLVMYATCLDYKEDQVHIPFILKKRRR
ncbi:MAG: DUF4159 domain-containing protein [Deltaproteobacteria bacterium]|nr:DUF4159 domain-containing protein [Deltaproteobacteria bacterium]